MNDNDENGEKKRKCEDPLETKQRKIIKTEEKTIKVENGSESDPLSLYVDGTHQKINIEIKAEPFTEHNLDNSNDTMYDSEGMDRVNRDVKTEVFEESETHIQFNEDNNEDLQAGNSESITQLKEAQARRKRHPWNKRRHVREEDFPLPPEIIEAKRQMEDAYRKMKPKSFDEYDTFGELIAMKIKNLKNPVARQVIMKDIRTLLLRAGMIETVERSLLHDLPSSIP